MHSKIIYLDVRSVLDMGSVEEFIDHEGRDALLYEFADVSARAKTEWKKGGLKGVLNWARDALHQERPEHTAPPRPGLPKLLPGADKFIKALIAETHKVHDPRVHLRIDGPLPPQLQKPRSPHENPYSAIMSNTYCNAFGQACRLEGLGGRDFVRTSFERILFPETIQEREAAEQYLCLEAGVLQIERGDAIFITNDLQFKEGAKSLNFSVVLIKDRDYQIALKDLDKAIKHGAYYNRAPALGCAA
jgi:hypothetical protein